MKFKLKKTSDYKYKSEVEINTIEELVKFVDENGDIILEKYKNDNIITIYDDYIE